MNRKWLLPQAYTVCMVMFKNSTKASDTVGNRGNTVTDVCTNHVTILNNIRQDKKCISVRLFFELTSTHCSQ